MYTAILKTHKTQSIVSLLPLLCDVIGAQAVVELSTAISLNVFPSTLTPLRTNDKNKCLHNSSGVSTSRYVSKNRRKPS